MNEPEATRLAREWIDNNYAGVTVEVLADVLARTVLKQHAEVEKLREALKAALEMSATYHRGEAEQLRAEFVPYDWSCGQCGGCGYGFHACQTDE